MLCGIFQKQIMQNQISGGHLVQPPVDANASTKHKGKGIIWDRKANFHNKKILETNNNEIKAQKMIF